MDQTIELHSKIIQYKTLMDQKRNGIFKLLILKNNKKNLTTKVMYHNLRFHFNKVFLLLKMYSISLN